MLGVTPNALLSVYQYYRFTLFVPLFFLLCSSPEAADSSSFDVQLGDIILTATDGLFDNMPDYMILQELKKLKVSLLEDFFFFKHSKNAAHFNDSTFLVFRLQTTTAYCRLHKVSLSKLTTLLTIQIICLLLHSLPVTMV